MMLLLQLVLHCIKEELLMRKLKQIFWLAMVLVLGIAQLCFGAEAKKLRVHLIYKVPETILQAQNREENIEEGKKEFEAMLLKSYSKRFDVRKVEYEDWNARFTLAQYAEKVSPLDVPFIVRVKLEGNGTTVDHYQNAFGAKVDAVSMTTRVHVVEYLVDRTFPASFSWWDYGTKSYGAGTTSLGDIVIANDTDPRTNTKNAVKACIGDINKFNDDKINKYTNPVAYEFEELRYKGELKKAAELRKKEEERKAAQEAPARARIQKFVDYVKAHPELGITNLVEANKNDLTYMNTLINIYVGSGLYKE